jgi:hypothetical protein
MRFRTDGIEFPNLAKGWAVPFPLTLIRRDWTLFFVGFRSWRKRARWARHKLNAAPPAIRIVVIAATVLAVVSVTNLVYQVVRKPTEMLFPVSGAMNKMPAETWQQYAPLFREYSTATITPELLAALAQVEGAGNPVARTYWRWRLTRNPFAVYQPASSAVGMYQMTDAAFAEARRYCIRHHTVVEDGCWFNGLILASSRATLSSSQRCFWTARSRRFLHADQTRPPTSSRSRSSPRSFIFAVQPRPRPLRAAASI